MTRSFVLASALVLSLNGVSHAGTIKQDIGGYRPGLTIKDQQQNPAVQKCKVWSGPISGEALSDKLSMLTDASYCEGGPYFRTGSYSQKVFEVYTEFLSDLPPAQVIRDACLQFRTDCSAAKDNIAMDLDGDLALVIRQTKRTTYKVHLYDLKVIQDEENLAPGPRGVPKL